MSAATQVARRYAEALADSAETQGNLSEVAADLRAFAALVAASKELSDLFANPIVQPEDKAAVLEAVLERAKPVALVASFLRVLQQNNRIQYLGAVDKAFGEEVDRRLGVVMADVTTAAPLTDEERATLSERLARLTGKKVKMTFSTDEELIGGVVTRIGSRIYDGSIRAKLDAIKRQMAGQAGT